MNKKLKDYAIYVTEKIDVSKLTEQNYIGMDNMLQNKRGIVSSNYKPNEGTAIKFKKGDVLVGNIRPYFKKIWLATFDGGCSQDVLCIRSKGEITPEFLYCILSQDIFFEYDMAGSKGAKMPRGDKNHIMDFPILDISKREQIGDFIITINNKINNNNNIKNELEKMLKLIFDYWFRQFEFPNEENKPYKSSGGKFVWSKELKTDIPVGWKVENMYKNSLCGIISPGVDFFDSKNYLATGNIEGEKVDDGEWVNFENRESRANMQPKENSVWFAKMKNSIKHITISDSAEWFVNKYILSTGFYGLQCSRKTLAYMHGFINSDFFELKKNSLAHGATQEAINNDDMKLIYFASPTDNVLQKYEEVAYNFLKEKDNLTIQNQQLEELREFLLPLLMNGQVKL